MIYILIVSIMIQAFTAIHALRLIKETGKAKAWVSISLAFIFMALRRMETLYMILFRKESVQPDLIGEIVALVTSLLMMVGVIWIFPIFHAIEKNNKSLRETNRALKTLSECNQAIIHFTDEQILMDKICRLIVEIGGYRFAWVGIAENNVEKNVRPVSKFGFEEGYLEKIRVTWDDSPTGMGPTGTAIKTGQVAIAKVLEKDVNFSLWLKAASKSGYQSSIALPLKVGDQCSGALNIYASEINAFNDAEVKLLEELANDLSYAINAIRINTQHKLAEEKNLTQLQQLNALRKIDISISGSLDLRIVLDVILDQCIQQLGVDAVRIFTYNQNFHTLLFKASKGFRVPSIMQKELKLGEGLSGKVVKEGKTIYVADLKNVKEQFLDDSDFENEKFVVYYGVPLISKGQVRGVLEVFHRSLLNKNPEWESFLETLAGQTAIAVESLDQYDRLLNLNTELALAYDRTLEGWSNALDLRDEDTEGHTLRVTEMTMKLAKSMGISDEELVHVRRGALLHDIGKMGIPDEILHKPGVLNEEERKMIQKHPQFAFDLLSPIRFLNRALDIPYSHHEKWDGSGYPRGLSENQIPLTARIFAVVDVWDALRSDRPYRKAWPEEKALAYIKEQSEKQFDPNIVNKFLEIYTDL